ncbi:MAG: hypothetical protein AAF721_11000 [Myxococcota bacterium]
MARVVGDGAFAEPQEFTLTTSSNDIDAGDFDGDGIDDLALTGVDAVVTFLSAGHTIL